MAVVRASKPVGPWEPGREAFLPKAVEEGHNPKAYRIFYQCECGYDHEALPPEPNPNCYISWAGMHCTSCFMGSCTKNDLEEFKHD